MNAFAWFFVILGVLSALLLAYLSLAGGRRQKSSDVARGWESAGGTTSPWQDNRNTWQ